jgi:EAL domain-containing protein (putative c-di-GMP-specific phosphodiesterase class I)
VGEGVERREQFEVLRALGCDVVQGYLFAEPMSETDFLSLVSEDSAGRSRAACSA